MLSSRLCLLLLVLAVATLLHANEDAPRVKTPLGAIKGYYKLSDNGRQYAAYEGIPYALPPIGKLRFKPPQRIPPWLGELPATKFGSPCIQYVQMPENPNDRVEGAEDCLYLNVYVPERETTDASKLEPLPVVFWIHGGGFQFGTGMVMGPKFLMDRDVIYVSINYRLGPFGFLSTEDEIVPGNMGLKDQSMALRWVSENIEWFGGNPKKITLVGLSAGGVSVHYQYLSPMSAELFQGGLSISGTALDCWAQTENALEKAKQLGAIVGCPTGSTKEMVRCLRYRPARTIAQTVSHFMKFYYNPFTPFGPVVEKFGDAPFINRSPVEIISSGDVYDAPWVTGVTSDEGLFPVAEFIAIDEALKKLEIDWDLIAPHYLDYNYTLPKEKHAEVARLIKTHYLGSKPIDKTTTKQLVQMSGDRFFVVGGETAARMQAKANKQPVWFYYYSYRGKHSLSEVMCGNTENYGVSHADDAYAVVDTMYLDSTSTPEDRKIQQKLIDFWVSFATNGVPSIGDVEWPRLDPGKNELSYLHIAGPEKIYMDSSKNLGEKNFWNSIAFNENKMRRSTTKLKEEL